MIQYMRQGYVKVYNLYYSVTMFKLIDVLNSCEYAYWRTVRT